MRTDTASSLHKYLGMKRLTVGILAALILGGCGVGAHDPEGEAAAGWQAPAKVTYEDQAQGMAAADGANRKDDSNPSPELVQPQTVNGTNPRASGLDVNFDRRKALPQDPIPLSTESEGKPPGGDEQDPVQ